MSTPAASAASASAAATAVNRLGSVPANAMLWPGSARWAPAYSRHSAASSVLANPSGAADAAGVDVSLASHSALGLHTARFSGPPAQQATALDRWRREVLALGGTVLVRERPAEVDAEIDPLGPAPSSVGLLRAVKGRLDPDGRCAPGRLAPWL